MCGMEGHESEHFSRGPIKGTMNEWDQLNVDSVEDIVRGLSTWLLMVVEEYYQINDSMTTMNHQ